MMIVTRIAISPILSMRASSVPVDHSRQHRLRLAQRALRSAKPLGSLMLAGLPRLMPFDVPRMLSASA
jgi:hypothetical protein